MSSDCLIASTEYSGEKCNFAIQIHSALAFRHLLPSKKLSLSITRKVAIFIISPQSPPLKIFKRPIGIL